MDTDQVEQGDKPLPPDMASHSVYNHIHSGHSKMITEL